MSSHLESDEAFARQLQAQELGLRSLPENYNAQTPLIRENNENPTLINARLSELSSARVTVAAIFVVHFPQVCAVVMYVCFLFVSADFSCFGNTFSPLE